MNHATFLEHLQSQDEATQAAAVENAALQPPAALRELAPLLESPDFELARRSLRAMQRLVRPATAPGAATRAKAVERGLIQCLDRVVQPQSKRHILWLLSEIGGRRAVQAIAPLLENPGLREDARCVLMRIPHRESRAALKAAQKAAPPEFQAALAYALRS